MRIDLHTHSTASDGTLRPAEVMRAAANAGVDVVALTDHDTTAGWEEARAAAPVGLTLIRGAELSCQWRPEGERPLSLHLLAYNFDETEPTFTAERERIRAARRDRGLRIVERLRADGVDVSWEQVQDYADGASVGRPHIGRALIARGYVEDMAGAFRPEWLGRKYRAPKAEMEVFDAIRMVRDAGGVTALAHPKAETRGRVVPDTLIAEMRDAGMQGIEVEHMDHSPAQQLYLGKLAVDLGLIPLGSSDFHGENKLVQIGANTTSLEAYERLFS